MLAIPPLPRFPLALIALSAAGALPIPATAQSLGAQSLGAQSVTSPAPAPDSAPDTGVVRLSDAQRDRILDDSTVDSAAAARGELTGPERDARGIHGIHGEVGMMIGTNGTRGAFGAADIPLGDNAAASIAVESSRFGYPRR